MTQILPLKSTKLIVFLRTAQKSKTTIKIRQMEYKLKSILSVYVMILPPSQLFYEN